MTTPAALREALDRLRDYGSYREGAALPALSAGRQQVFKADLALLTASVQAGANYGELPKDRDHPFWSTQLPATCSDEETVRFARDLYTSLPDLAPMGWAEAMRLLAAAADAGARAEGRAGEAERLRDGWLAIAAQFEARLDRIVPRAPIAADQPVEDWLALVDAKLGAGARAREALAALAVPCEALLRAEAAGEVAGMRPMLSDEVSKALKAGVILMRAALLAPTEGRRDGK